MSWFFKDKAKSSQGPSKPQKQDKFGKDGYLTRSELREKLRKAPYEIPNSAKWFTRKERVSIERELFGGKYGTHITSQEYRERLRELEREKLRAKTAKEKLNIDRKRRLLKKLGGF